MSTETETIETAANARFRTNNNRLGLWLFMISDSFLFLGLFASRFYLLGGTRPDLNQPLGLAVTSILLLSSFFMNRAEISMAHGDVKAFQRSTLVTIFLGLLFLVGVVGVEWPNAPFRVSDSAMSSIFFTMTGYHALHVLTGLIFLVIVFRNSRKGIYSTEKHFPVEAAAVYWHFVDVVWVFFYPSLYLMGVVLR
jgi:cytochrome c oxidase subunit 3